MSVSQSTLDVTSFIDARKVGGFQLVVIALCAAVVFIDGFDTQAIAYVAPSIAKEWKLAPGALGPVFGAGLFGLMVGALILGPVADRIGRKPVIIVSVLAFGLFSLLTVTADSLTSLFMWRFLTGIGLGGAMPNAIALTAEYCPQRRRAALVMVMFIGFSLGSAIGGFLATVLVPRFGWVGVFWVGGLVPLVLAPLLLARLPESIRLLALHGGADHRIRALLARIDADPTLDDADRFVVAEEARGGVPVAHLFRDGRALATILLWIMFFMSLLDLYFLINWLPTVINASGVEVGTAVLISTMFQVGGIVGTLALAPLLDRGKPFAVLAFAYAAAALLIVVIGRLGGAILPLTAAIFAAGFCLTGAQIGANALTAVFYPTYIRSTGIGWALGIGRIGSIVGPIVAGVLLALRWPTPDIFLLGALPAVIGAAAAFAIGRETARAG
jgi:AAHS family 4-hydroxybenzoate transporter-like MFS transporter